MAILFRTLDMTIIEKKLQPLVIIIGFLQHLQEHFVFIIGKSSF
jgi:hypothetical protein